MIIVAVANPSLVLAAQRNGRPRRDTESAANFPQITRSLGVPLEQENSRSTVRGILKLSDILLLQARLGIQNRKRNCRIAQPDALISRESVQVAEHGSRRDLTGRVKVKIRLDVAVAFLAGPFRLHPAECAQAFPRPELGVGVEDMRLLVQQNLRTPGGKTRQGTHDGL